MLSSTNGGPYCCTRLVRIEPRNAAAVASFVDDVDEAENDASRVGDAKRDAPDVEAVEVVVVLVTLVAVVGDGGGDSDEPTRACLRGAMRSEEHTSELQSPC